MRGAVGLAAATAGFAGAGFVAGFAAADLPACGFAGDGFAACLLASDFACGFAGSGFFAAVSFVLLLSGLLAFAPLAASGFAADLESGFAAGLALPLLAACWGPLYLQISNPSVEYFSCLESL